MTLAVTNTGTLNGPTNYSIKNNNYYPIRLVSVTVDVVTGYTLTNVTTPTANNAIYATLNNLDISGWTLSSPGTPNWIIGAATDATNPGTLSLTFAGQVKAITDDLTTSQKVFTITYTVAPSLG